MEQEPEQELVTIIIRFMIKIKNMIILDCGSEYYYDEDNNVFNKQTKKVYWCKSPHMNAQM